MKQHLRLCRRLRSSRVGEMGKPVDANVYLQLPYAPFYLHGGAGRCPKFTSKVREATRTERTTAEAVFHLQMTERPPQMRVLYLPYPSMWQLLIMQEANPECSLLVGRLWL
jgi:hypothetical protein